jgi:hypothetical protein
MDAEQAQTLCAKAAAKYGGLSEAPQVREIVIGTNHRHWTHVTTRETIVHVLDDPPPINWVEVTDADALVRVSHHALHVTQYVVRYFEPQEVTFSVRDNRLDAYGTETLHHFHIWQTDEKWKVADGLSDTAQTAGERAKRYIIQEDAEQ